MLLYWHDVGQVPGDEEGNETPEQLRTYFTLNDNLKPVGVGRALTCLIYGADIIDKIFVWNYDKGKKDDHDKNVDY